MLGSYLIKTTKVSKEIAQELTQFGSVGLVSRAMCIYSIETQVEFIPTIEALSFVEAVDDDNRRYLPSKKA